jgi:small conductance mechanosensitive channel
MEIWLNKVYELAAAYLPKLALALLTLVLGLWLAGRMSKLTRRIVERRNLDPALRSFLADLVNVGLKVMVLITAAGMIGIETTSFIAVLGAAGLAVGLALQGSLSNFAGGVMILLFRPFRIGDLIAAQDQLGHVRAINLFVTTLESLESRTIIVPNAMLSNGIITNYSTLGHIRVDVNVGIAYKENIARAREVLMEVIRSRPEVLADPAPAVHVVELGESAVVLGLRPYTRVEHYWAVFFGLQEASKNALDEAGIEIPFPQRVVHQVD